MANNARNVPPLPFAKLDTNDTQWQLWFNRVRVALNTVVGWFDIDFTGSNLTSIQTRRHNDLQNISGAGQYHITPGAASFIEGSSYGAYAPVLTNFTNVTGTVGSYTQVGNLVIATINLTGSSGINVGANATVTLPVVPIKQSVASTTNYTIVGSVDTSSGKILFTTGGAASTSLSIQAMYIFK
jgi:hypothetical protein